MSAAVVILTALICTEILVLRSVCTSLSVAPARILCRCPTGRWVCLVTVLGSEVLLLMETSNEPGVTVIPEVRGSLSNLRLECLASQN